MLIEGKFILPGRVQEVWNFLYDPQLFLSCVPGAEKIEAIDDKTYDAVLTQKVGPVSVKLKFTTTLVEMDPPRHVKAVGRGADIGKAGTFTQESVVNLTQISEDCVEISYSSNVSLVGRLATFGDRIMRAKTKEMQEVIVKNLAEKLAARIGSETPNIEFKGVDEHDERLEIPFSRHARGGPYPARRTPGRVQSHCRRAIFADPDETRVGHAGILGRHQAYL